MYNTNILAKGIDIETNKPVVGYYLYHIDTGMEYILTGHSKSYPVDFAHPHLVVQGFEWIAIKAGSAGMFTGLKDINGEDIFENDIVEYVFSNYSPNPRFIVVYSPKEAKFKLRAIGSTEAFVEVKAQDFAEKYRVVK